MLFDGFFGYQPQLVCNNLHHQAKFHWNWFINSSDILITAINQPIFNSYWTPVTLSFNQFFWLSKFVLRHLFYSFLPNLIKIGQKLREISRLQLRIGHFFHVYLTPVTLIFDRFFFWVLNLALLLIVYTILLNFVGIS